MAASSIPWQLSQESSTWELYETSLTHCCQQERASSSTELIRNCLLLFPGEHMFQHHPLATIRFWKVWRWTWCLDQWASNLIPCCLVTVCLSILPYLLLVLMGSTCLSEAFRGQQVLINHARQKRKGGSFLSPCTKEKRKAESKKLALRNLFWNVPLGHNLFWHILASAPGSQEEYGWHGHAAYGVEHSWLWPAGRVARFKHIPFPNWYFEI